MPSVRRSLISYLRCKITQQTEQRLPSKTRRCTTDLGIIESPNTGTSTSREIASVASLMRPDCSERAPRREVVCRAARGDEGN